MSFILDALKKSEDERLRQAGPSLADAPIRKRRTERPWWAIAVAALLIVNMVVLGIVLARGKSAPAAAAVTPIQYAPAPQPVASIQPSIPAIAPAPVVQSARAALEAQPTDNATAVQPIQGPAVSPSQTPPPATVVASQMDTAALAPAQNYNAAPQNYSQPQSYNPPPPATAPGTQPAPAAVPAQPLPQVAATGSSSVPTNLPTANEAMATGGINVPLHLDLHVYAQNASGRFVFINNRKYLEGQTITEGPVVEQITPDGVVLTNHGQRFILPRQ